MSAQSSKFVTLLKCVYALLLIVFPVFSVIFLFTNVRYTIAITSGQANFLSSTFFLVALFVFFMQLLFAKYYPSTVRGMLALIFGPLLLALPQLLEGGWQEYIINTGIIYFSGVMLSFAALVAFGPFLKGKFNDPATRTRKTLLQYYAFAAAPQLLFLIPGLGATYICLKVLYMVEVAPFFETNQLQLLYAVFLLAAIVQQAYSLFESMREESIIGGKY